MKVTNARVHHVLLACRAANRSYKFYLVANTKVIVSARLKFEIIKET